jgi:hypothetical protein
MPKQCVSAPYLNNINKNFSAARWSFMDISIVKYILLGDSFITLTLSLIFLLSPKIYLRLEEILSIEIFPETVWLTVLEGKINFINDWIFQNRVVFGTLFVFVSLYNIKTIIAL